MMADKMHSAPLQMPLDSRRPQGDNYGPPSPLFPKERRRRVRTSVHWRLKIYGATSKRTAETITTNLSSDGLYCIIDGPFTVGEKVTMLLEAPAHDPTGSEPTCSLRCEGCVVRVETTSAANRFGVACRIDDFVLQRRNHRAPAA